MKYKYNKQHSKKIEQQKRDEARELKRVEREQRVAGVWSK